MNVKIKKGLIGSGVPHKLPGVKKGKSIGKIESIVMDGYGFSVTINLSKYGKELFKPQPFSIGVEP